MTATRPGSRAAAHDSLRALALGDAFGERWFPLAAGQGSAGAAIRERRTPQAPRWPWTDDTAMALSVFAVLDRHGEVRQEELAREFGERFLAEPARGYGSGMHQLLPLLARRPDRWREEADGLFDGQGSLGNGAAMRVAPLGAWFTGDPERAAEQAALSAQVTHAHPEGTAGAVAVAVAAALAADRTTDPPGPAGLLAEIADRTPEGAVRDGLLRAAGLPPDTEPAAAAAALGSGYRIRADDTVPFALWCAAGHLDDLTEALWTTAAGLGDVDTTCAIAGGVVGGRTGLADVPDTWLERAEPLPAAFAA
ncbi:ADP-ribosylglycohydrolase family protein [Streptomyces sp. F63]|uniref:ADP-ribosylglycohydrolase family protein n=1 Tax=Streptomyces sp. F63 TaxID=2824887 RepID=UPI001B3673F7|nr:ADP-ribosylglycohydrolase family protein [Streptomyces sp. F63]MBQ0983968.1 ADP-ribosylglycohydrolase family protein [Streptomyces sp. F63]